MKRFFYILFISTTIFFSFGFRGCDKFFCYFLWDLNYYAYGGVGSFYERTIVGDDGVVVTCVEDDQDCFCGVSALSNFDLRAVGSLYGSNLNSNLQGFTTMVIIGDTGTVFFSPDGGVNWEDRSIPGLTKNLYDLDFFSGSSGFQVVVCGEGGTVYTSTISDSSWNWQQINTITTQNLNSVILIANSYFVAVGEKGTIIRSSDGGQTWEDKSVPDTSAHFNKVFNGDESFATGKAWAVADNGKIWVTANYGISWNPRFSGVTDNLYDVAFRNEFEGIVVGANGVVRYTSNGGVSWLEDPYFSGLTNDDIISLAIKDENTATALVRGTTTDGRATTTMITVSSEPFVAVDDNNNIIPSEYSLEQNYPNPFNPSTTIQFSIPEPSFVTLEIFNALGEKITTLVSKELNAGNHKFEWSSTIQPAGIYFYKLSTNSFQQTKKLVLLK